MVAAAEPNAFRKAEKAYQLHKEHQLRISKGRKQGGKFVTRPVDFSDVIDFGGSATQDISKVRISFSKSLGKAICSLRKHPGCHVIPGHLDAEQQVRLFKQALTLFPEPPNSSNLTAHHGHLPALWAAAQQGLFLKSHHPQTDHTPAPDSIDVHSSRHCLPSQSKQAAIEKPVPVSASSPTALSTVRLCNQQQAQRTQASALDANKGHSLSTVEPAEFPPAGRSEGRHNSAAASKNAQLACSGISSPRDDCTQHCTLTDRCWSELPVGPSAASLMQKLRWIALGPQFNWSTRQYKQETGVKPLPSELVTLAQDAVQACLNMPVHAASLQHCNPTAASCRELGCAEQPKYCHAGSGIAANCATDSHLKSCQTYVPDAALVNFYRDGDTLGGHKDDAELHDMCPIVSVSLGCDGVFLIGGQTKDTAPTALCLHSGDVVVLSGPARQCYHGVPRVLPGQLSCSSELSQIDNNMATYMSKTRVNLSIRQT